jgi:hypothetical protein
MGRMRKHNAQICADFTPGCGGPLSNPLGARGQAVGEGADLRLQALQGCEASLGFSLHGAILRHDVPVGWHISVKRMAGGV